MKSQMKGIHLKMFDGIRNKYSSAKFRNVQSMSPVQAAIMRMKNQESNKKTLRDFLQLWQTRKALKAPQKFDSQTYFDLTDDELKKFL